ncbi:MAG: SDR family oxidoreductase [Sphingomonadaceae bacterium]|nr:SDR family oxidoreductase [Sphingomonadaceae bacterium]
MRVASGARRFAVVTGANGGMGRACARMIGETMELVLTDINGVGLHAFAEDLRNEGYSVRAVLAGDLADPGLTKRIGDAAGGSAGFGALIHTAALSPALAPWERIMRANAVGTARLLGAIEPLLQPGAVAVLIASMAAHMAPVLADVDAILDDPLAADFLDCIGKVIDRLADHKDPRGPAIVSYGLSKRMVMRMCEHRAALWARNGARIVSISPGTIWTPMGRKEAEENPTAARVVAATPAARWGTVMDIAAAARFLISDSASFVTGTDLRIDGGVTPVLRTAQLAG